MAADSGRIRGVAREDFDGNGTAFGVAKQSEVDLPFALFAIAIVPELSEHTGATLVVSGGEVIEHGRTGLQVLTSEVGFDLGLALQKPAHGGIEIVFVNMAQRKFLAERAGGSVRVEVTRQSQFGACEKDAAHDESNG